MKVNKNVLIAANVICLVLIGIHATTYFFLLPDYVSNGNVPKLYFTITYAGISIVITSTFIAIGYFLPRFPVHCINLPNAEFWFNQENRQESFDFLTKWMYTYSLLILSMLFAVFQILCTANFQTQFPTWIIWIPIGLFMIFTGVVVFWLVYRFKYLGIPYSRVSDNL